jgi:hypothetical protein
MGQLGVLIQPELLNFPRQLTILYLPMTPLLDPRKPAILWPSASSAKSP